MKVRAIKPYNDLQLKKYVRAGDEFEVTEERAAELTSENNKAGQVLCEVVTEVAPEDKPKKQTKKKAAKNE